MVYRLDKRLCYRSKSCCSVLASEREGYIKEWGPADQIWARKSGLGLVPIILAKFDQQGPIINSERVGERVRINNGALLIKFGPNNRDEAFRQVSGRVPIFAAKFHQQSPILLCILPIQTLRHCGNFLNDNTGLCRAGIPSDATLPNPWPTFSIRPMIQKKRSAPDLWPRIRTE